MRSLVLTVSSMRLVFTSSTDEKHFIPSMSNLRNGSPLKHASPGWSGSYTFLESVLMLPNPGEPHVRCIALAYVRFTPKSGHREPAFGGRHRHELIILPAARGLLRWIESGHSLPRKMTAESLTRFGIPPLRLRRG